ncbi:hypothetical protein, partial [Pseudomonas oleovorans]|uniref:hypothetical protein n=1 Tax=Ectopseudomonas oleovorans TaxID=301 RepID=UPI0028E48DED
NHCPDARGMGVRVSVESALTLPFLAVTMTNVTLNICPSLPGFLSPLEAIMACLGSGGFWGIGGIMGGLLPQSMWSHAAARLVKYLKNKGFIVLLQCLRGLKLDSKSVVSAMAPRVQIPIFPPY